ncbi:tetratricopeptide repeat protein 38-like isoform X2 [Mya arenaria]|uniref:tetratricopeptide repeat protein 38-like isoform X2 n=1 Tax=Mya arenaria TaxID=6604 RepID=UPI0022DFD191|nr:tetratricopeptide repeat protein 38-like isoform X2 [Mya arenaria]
MPPHPHTHWRDAQAWKSFGLEMSTPSDETCKMFDATLTQMVNHYDDEALGGMEKCLERMLTADPEFVLGLAMKNAFASKHVYQDFTHAKEVYRMMEIASLPHVNKRERNHAIAVKLLSEGKSKAASLVWEDILVEHPTDILAAKFLHDTYILNGNSLGLRHSCAGVVPYWKPDMPFYGDMLSMYAFGLEETNTFTEAEKYAQKALEINRHDTWATHCIAHINEMTGEARKGVKFMEQTENNWNDDGLQCHNYWHWALHYFEMGEFETAVSLLDKQILPTMSKNKSWFSLTDAASLCFRLEAEGYDIGKRWSSCRDVASEHLDHHMMSYADFHVLMSFVRGGDKELTDRMISGIKETIRNDEGDIAVDYKELTLPVMEALMAFDEGEYDTAVTIMRPLKYQMSRIGGSNAQRDVFNLLTIHAGIRSKSPESQKYASNLLMERKQLKAESPLAERLLQRIVLAH